MDEEARSTTPMALKARKPYTITKQRERWAEEEHAKFLEALQLYGRAWRRIQEHIGTKTAVQIRSHAQKFFSKVERESGSDGPAGAKQPIEIPPPRPKRKPAHPYPRKLGNAGGGSSNGGLSPVKSAFEQDNGSPTSVLSGAGSDALGSLLSNLQSSCAASPVASAAGSSEQGTCLEEENNLPAAAPRDGLTTDLRMSCRGDSPSKEDEEEGEEQGPCLKLFGKTIMVNDSRKPSPRHGTCQASPEPCSSDEGERRKECSWAGSSAASASDGANTDSSQSADRYDDIPAIRRKRPSSGASPRGFVPYKRCVVEKEAVLLQQHRPRGMAGNGEGQSVWLCL